jgi:YesN/AraC family two-component response regulator
MATILAIDDEKGIRDIIQMSFEISGHTVLIASNGKDGSALASKHAIDLVITDIFMPEQDGFETIRHLKSVAPSVKIIAISGGGYFDPNNALKMANLLGAHYGFNKPFDIQDLINKTNQLLEK